MKRSLTKSWRTTLGGLFSIASLVCVAIPGAQFLVPILGGIGGVLTGINAADHKTVEPSTK